MPVLNMLKKIVTPNAHRRRIMAGICAAFVLVTIFFSSVLLAADADHDCAGRDCPICLEMQNCAANFQLLGSSTPSGTGVLSEICHFPVETAPCAHRAPVTTLQSLDVRFDE